MAPRRSARVSAAAQQAASEQKNTSAQGQLPKANKPARQKKTVAQNGITKKANTSRKKTTTTTSKAKQPARDNKKATPAKAITAAEEASLVSNPNTIPTFKVPSTPTKRQSNSNNNPDLNRPIDPHFTTATLRTPRGSHLTAYPPSTQAQDISPSKTGLPRPTTTTGTLLEEAVAHLLKIAPQLKAVIDKHPCPLFSPAGLAEEIDPFNALASGIIGQQVSGAAARSIKRKFVALFDAASNNDNKGEVSNANNNNNNSSNEILGTTAPSESAEAERYDNSPFPTPEQVAKCDLATLRTAGLSQRKAEYIQGLAEKFANGELSAQMLLRASDEEVLEKLIAVRGLGRWSVEMFECFGLKRMDVFSTGDLGVQRGMAAFVGRDVSKLKAKGGGKFKYMSEKDMIEIAAPFSPYRSLFMWYMWRIEDVDVSVMT
ncbi:3-methyladenine DNA glycosylase [Onygenales sp. PD_10]|nr:3-methyladenine DNA glycosylase [Onygenales sp. PD_10]